MTKQELNNLTVGRKVAITTKSQTLKGNVFSVNPFSDSIYGKNLMVTIRSFDKSWFGSLEITSHGDYGAIKYEDVISVNYL